MRGKTETVALAANLKDDGPALRVNPRFKQALLFSHIFLLQMGICAPGAASEQSMIVSSHNHKASQPLCTR